MTTQPLLPLALYRDARPIGERTAAERYVTPSMFDWVPPATNSAEVFAALEQWHATHSEADLRAYFAVRDRWDPTHTRRHDAGDGR